MSALRNWIARKLAPDIFRTAEAHSRLRSEAEGDFHWLAYDCPEAAITLRWLLDKDHNYRRALGEPAIGGWPDDISQFRESLRRRRAALTPAEDDKAQSEVGG